jgi:hypothetical protein
MTVCLKKGRTYKKHVVCRCYFLSPDICEDVMETIKTPHEPFDHPQGAVYLFKEEETL